MSTFFDESDPNSADFVKGLKEYINSDSKNLTLNGGNDTVAAVSALGYDAYMNPQETQELAEFIVQTRDKYGLTVFLIEHHMDLVMKISDYIYVIDFGSEIAEGVPSEVQNNQRVIDAYLGVVDDE